MKIPVSSHLAPGALGDDLAGKSIKELKGIIEAHGGSYQGIVEKVELVQRARDTVASPARGIGSSSCV